MGSKTSAMISQLTFSEQLPPVVSFAISDSESQGGNSRADIQ